MGFIDAPRYVFPINALVHNTPVASSTYYISNVNAAPGVTSGVGALFVPMRSTLLYVNIVILTLTPGTAEQGTISVRINSTTDYVVSSTVQWNATRQVAFNDPFSAPVMTDPLSGQDVWEIKIQTPAWVLAPVGVIYSGSLTFGNIY